MDEQDGRRLRVRLMADGIHFTIAGAADPVQRRTTDALALLLDSAKGKPLELDSPAGPELPGKETRAARFLRRLAVTADLATVSAIRELLTFWEKLGGWIG
ncbi:hypothetical protein [Streptomyces sp. NPDC048410]|uniref:hypothetical protein n=1 Tax=Streptomyces sp. NPDC048410 TaxID=3365545 RepID=UPI0037128A74